MPSEREETIHDDVEHKILNKSNMMGPMLAFDKVSYLGDNAPKLMK